MLTDQPCPFPGCGLPVELQDVRVFQASDGAVAVEFFRCPAGHNWPEVWRNPPLTDTTP